MVRASKSMDLVINMAYIFFAFSNFSSFHETMTQYKMGDMVSSSSSSSLNPKP